MGCVQGMEGRSSSGLASAHPQDAVEGQSSAVLGLSRGSRLTGCWLLARAGVLCSKHPRNPQLTLCPGLLGDGAVWLLRMGILASAPAELVLLPI